MPKALTKKQQTIVSQLLVMHEMFPSNKSELVYDTPFQLLIAVVMSAQTTDKQVNKVTKVLRRFVQTPQDVVALGHDRIRDMISSVNYNNSKAKYIYQTAQMLSDPEWISVYLNDHPDQQESYDTHGYVIPQDISQLILLSGVGVKTAKVVLHVLYGQLWIAADTHVHRVANRLGRVRTKDPAKTSEKLESLTPDEYKHIAHHSIILRGRYHCKAMKPKCDGCPLLDQCKREQKFMKK